MNRRTADVYSPGYATLFKLDKEDLEEVVKEYPEAEQALKEKAAEILREKETKDEAPPKETEVELKESEIETQKQNAEPIESDVSVKEMEKDSQNLRVEPKQPELQKKSQNANQKSSENFPETKFDHDLKNQLIVTLKNENQSGFCDEKSAKYENGSAVTITQATASASGSREGQKLRSKLIGGTSPTNFSIVMSPSNTLQVFSKQHKRESHEHGMYVPSKLAFNRLFLIHFLSLPKL